MILDGPVDAIWIENLNSVLDDNKTLTLANGDRIPMAANAKILFEVHNIDNASPATVSRNGMVFMSSSIMNWDPIINGWMLENIPAAYHDTVFSTYASVWVDAYNFITTKLWPKMLLLECMYARQALDLLKGLIPSGDDIKELKHDTLKKYIVFSIMWSLGSLLELDDRKKVRARYRALIFRHAVIDKTLVCSCFSFKTSS